MTPRDIIIEILCLKQKLVKKKTGLDYIMKEDLNEVRSWSEEECGNIIKYMEKIRGVGADVPHFDDYDICPWCIKNATKEECVNCSYGRRHGNCLHDSESNYMKIKNKLTYGICEISGVCEGVFTILRKNKEV